MGPRDRVYPKKKITYFKTMNQLLDDNDKILIVQVENVTSAMLQNIRMMLRGKASLLLGKNTMMKKVLHQRNEAGSDRDKLLYQKLVSEKLIAGNVGLVFTNAELSEIKKVLDDNKIQAPARQGAVAPCDVAIPAGNTGLEPTKTSFFQALNIQTKITKGTVEILKDVNLIKQGDKVGSSEATLLQMLAIKPFFYGVAIQNVYDNGSVYGAWVLDIKDEDMNEKIGAAISNVAALSLGLGIPTKASFPHSVLNAFKNILSISVGTDYTFDEFNGKTLKQSILAGPVAPAASSAPAAGAAPAKEEKKEEEEEDDADMGFGLFG
jgi:large subunit ribosomal protein LP0